MATSAPPRQRRRTVVRAAAAGAAALMGTLAAFELALAAGLPWGRAAWGGGQETLDGGLRVASVVAAAVYLAAALVVLRGAGYRVWTPIPSRWVTAVVWGISGYAALGTLLNAVSPSDLERAVMTPVGGCLAVLCATVAAGGRRR
ncbi:MAG: hypothetical protein ACRDWG_15500 [Actinomycetes bacterium]